MQFPSWLSRNEVGSYIVDQAKAYPIALGAMKVDPDKATAADLECAFQCIKMKVQALDEDNPEGFTAKNTATKIFFEGNAESKKLYCQAGRKPGNKLTTARLREVFRAMRPALA